MSSPFDITAATNTIALDNKGAGVATFTVKNNTRRRIRATAKVSTQPPAAAQWLTIRPQEGSVGDSPSVRDIPVESTVQYQVDVAIPPDAPPGGYTVKLLVAEEINPDENFSESPEVTFVVPEPPKPEQPGVPRWLIPAIIIAVLVIVAIVVIAVVSGNNQPNEAPTVDQTADKLTQIKLNACPTYSDSDPMATPPARDRLIRSGMNGADVRAAQTRLCELGYTPGNLDGIFGPNTLQAVRAFQTANSLSADGIVGPDTWDKLFSVDAARAP